MSWTLCTSGSAIWLAGENADTDAQAGDNFDKISDYVEGLMCMKSHTDLVTNYSGYDTEIQNALGMIASGMIAKFLVTYNQTGYKNSRASETILDVIDDTINEGMQLIKDKSNLRLSTS